MTVSEILPNFENKKKNLAKELGLCPLTISRWGAQVPAKWVSEVEQVLGHKKYAAAQVCLAEARQKLHEAKRHFNNAKGK